MRVEGIQGRFSNLRNTAPGALVDLIGDIKAEKAKVGATEKLSSSQLNEKGHLTREIG
ncbi:MAG: hypothetical protein WB762_23910 [Candidatus Sulfotelmatobacter sp.]